MKKAKTKSSLIKSVLSCGRIHGFKYLLDEKITIYEKWVIKMLELKVLWVFYVY